MKVFPVTKKIYFYSDAHMNPNDHYFVLIMSLPGFIERCSPVFPTISITTFEMENTTIVVFVETNYSFDIYYMIY